MKGLNFVNKLNIDLFDYFFYIRIIFNNEVCPKLAGFLE